MSETVASRLAALGLTLPKPVAPVANYVPHVRSGGLLFISGQVPIRPDGTRHEGKLGADRTIEEGQAAARQCALNALAVAAQALDGDLERIVRCVKLMGLVNCTPDFIDQPKVVNGASDLMVAALGDRGRHARTAFGVASLPLGVSVEVETTFEVA